MVFSAFPSDTDDFFIEETEPAPADAMHHSRRRQPVGRDPLAVQAHSLENRLIKIKPVIRNLCQRGVVWRVWVARRRTRTTAATTTLGSGFWLLGLIGTLIITLIQRDIFRLF